MLKGTDLTTERADTELKELGHSSCNKAFKMGFTKYFKAVLTNYTQTVTGHLFI